MPDIRMIVTDLDGTLIGRSNDFPLYSTFRDKMNEVRARDGAIWAACTGRSLKSFRNFFTPMRMMDIVPDYVIVHHAYIYSVRDFLYVPHVLWNWRIWCQVRNERKRVREAVADWHRTFSRMYRRVRTIHKGKERLCLRFDSEEAASVAEGLLKEKADGLRYLQVFRYLMELDIMSVPFTKGLAMSELARHLMIDREHILTIGNGHNDISMLDGRHAKLTGCPINSEPEVIATVHRSGGHIAPERSLKGVLSVLNAHMTDSVCSDLPEGWKDPSKTNNPRSRRAAPRKDRKSKSRDKNKTWLIAITTYVVLVVLANFNILPGPISRIIKFPLDLLLWLIEKAIAMVPT